MIPVGNENLVLRDEWWTPDGTFNELSKRYGGFDLDVAASALNAKCKHYYTVEDNALEQPWHGKVWCNPPYKHILTWILKAHEEVLSGRASLVCLLLPSHTSTEWFHYALEHGSIEFIKGRLKFGGSKGKRKQRESEKGVED